MEIQDLLKSEERGCEMKLKDSTVKTAPMNPNREQTGERETISVVSFPGHGSEDFEKINP